MTEETKKLSEEELLFLAQCDVDTREYAKFFYPGRFKLDFTYQHDMIFEAIDAKNSEGLPEFNKIVVKAGRGIGKSTICKTIAAKRIRYRQARLIGYLGKSYDFASTQTNFIKNGMLSNKRENHFFDSINVKDVDDAEFRAFGQKLWVTSNGCMVVPRGCLQQIAGFHFDWEGETFRFDLIILDDLEDRKQISSEIYRKATKEYIYGDVLEAVPPEKLSMDWQVIYIDTLKHEDSALQMLLDSEDWHSIDLATCDDNYNSLIPTFVSTEKLQQKVELARENGTLDVFYREHGLGAISKENPCFRQDYFKRYEESDAQFLDELKAGEIETVLIVDPTKSSNPGSADSALVVWGINRLRRKWYLRDIIKDKLHNNDLYEEIIALLRQYNIRAMGLEVNSLNEYILFPLRNYMFSKGVFAEIIEMKPRTQAGAGEDPKVHRAKALIPFYRQGRVYHNKTVAGLLETPLLSFPRPKKWDVIDAAAYIVQMLETGDRYFVPERSEGDKRRSPTVSLEEALALQKPLPKLNMVHAC